MTERGRGHVQRTARQFVVGRSQLAWDGQALVIEVDERGAPWPQRVFGRVRVHPQGLSRFVTPLDDAGRHRWGPIAPCARVEVDLPWPGLRWSGSAYLDSNEGDEPIEQAFAQWDWMRFTPPGGGCQVVYDVQTRSHNHRLTSVAFAPDGSVRDVPPGPLHTLPPTRWWRIARAARLPAEQVRVVRTLEDTPFYSRSLLELRPPGASPEPVRAVHESLDVARLTSAWVQRLLPFRMPRTA